MMSTPQSDALALPALPDPNAPPPDAERFGPYALIIRDWAESKGTEVLVLFDGADGHDTVATLLAARTGALEVSVIQVKGGYNEEGVMIAAHISPPEQVDDFQRAFARALTVAQALAAAYRTAAQRASSAVSRDAWGTPNAARRNATLHTVGEFRAFLAGLPSDMPVFSEVEPYEELAPVVTGVHYQLVKLGTRRIGNPAPAEVPGANLVIY